MENSHYPFDQQPPQDNTLYELVTNTEAWTEFCHLVHEIEIEADELNLESDTAVKTLNDYEDTLNYTFGEEYYEKKAKLRGIAYIADDKGIRTGDYAVVQTHETIRFVRVALNQVDGSWKVELEFLQPRFTEAQSNCYYNVSPQNVLQLELASSTDEDDDLIEEAIESEEVVLETHVTMAKSLTTDNEFLTLPRYEQHQQLANVCTDMNQEVCAVKYNVQAEIACARYYTVFDDMQSMHIPLEDCYTNQSYLQESDRIAIRGKVERFTYAELIDNPNAHFTQASDYTIGDGAPCLSVYDEQRACRYFLVPDCIGPIKIIDQQM